MTFDELVSELKQTVDRDMWQGATDEKFFLTATIETFNGDTFTAHGWVEPAGSEPVADTFEAHSITCPCRLCRPRLYRQ